MRYGLLVLAFAISILFFSPDLQLLGPLALWVPVALVSAWLPSPVSNGGKKSASNSPSTGGITGQAALLLVAIVLSLFPNQRIERQDYDLPRRHALNLLTGVGEKTALLFTDSFEADACRVVQKTEGRAPGALILDRAFLNQRWYLEQLILRFPEWMFATVDGSRDAVFQDMVTHNLSRWEIRWAVSELPEPWPEVLARWKWKAYPQVLTQRIVSTASPMSADEDLTARFDLSGLTSPPSGTDPAFQKIRSRYARGFYDLGRQREQSAKYSLSIRSYERAVKLNPEDAAPREALAAMYKEKRILEAARMEFEKILKGHPAQIELWMRRVGQYGRGGSNPRILEALDEVIRLNVELSDAQYHLGLIYEREGKTRESQILLESAAKLAPQRIEVQMELGRQMLRAGNRPRAEEAFRAVLNIDPENKEAQKQLWKILNRP